MDQITFSQKLDFQKFFWFTLRYTFTRPFLLILQIVWGLMIAFLLLGVLLTGDPPEQSWEMLRPFLVMMGFLYIFYPLLVYFIHRNAFNTNEILKNTVQYDISSQGISTKGDSYQSQMGWNKVYKVKEYKDRFLVFLSRRQAIHFEKGNFPSVADIEIFKSIVRLQPNVKVSKKF